MYDENFHIGTVTGHEAALNTVEASIAYDLDANNVDGN